MLEWEFLVTTDAVVQVCTIIQTCGVYSNHEHVCYHIKVQNTWECSPLYQCFIWATVSSLNSSQDQTAEGQEGTRVHP